MFKWKNIYNAVSVQYKINSETLKLRAFILKLHTLE